jgi:hypothetical protein
MLRFLPILSTVMILAIAGPATADSPFNVDFFCGWGGCYRPMEWTPVEIGISATFTEPFAGSVTLSAQQDGLNTLNIVHTFVLTPDVPLHLPLVTKLTFAADKCTLRIRDKRGRTQWHQDIGLWDFSTRNRLLTALGESDLLIGLVGQRKFGLLQLDKKSICESYAGRGKVYVADKLPRMVPWDWTGFAPLDLLILYDPDWDLFNQHQLNAIAQWVSNGGKLLLVLGSHPPPMYIGASLAQLLPFEVHQVKQITIPWDILKVWGLDTSKTETVASWPLTPKPGVRLYETETDDANECLFAAGYVGFGRVGVLAFDPSTMSDTQRANSARFWVGRITATLEDIYARPADIVEPTLPPSQSPGRSRSPVRSNPDVHRDSTRYPMHLLDRSIRFTEDAESLLREGGNGNRYETGRAYVASNAIMEHLYNIAEMRPLSIWWVILLLSALAILLGPVDYFVLKRKDRLPLTWLTCSFWIIVFSVGAYYGVQALRGGKMQLRVVSVLDGIENAESPVGSSGLHTEDGKAHAWSTTYCGLFAPRSADYKLEGLQEHQWWSGIAPTEGSIWAFNQEVGTRKIYCFQHDGANLPYSLPINIWTVQCLLNESPLQQMPFAAEVECQGDQVIVTITNQADSRIASGFVLFDNNQGIEFGQVPAVRYPDGRTREFRGKLRRLSVMDYNIDGQGRLYYTRQRGGSYPSVFKHENAFFAQGCLRRTQGIGAYLAHGGAIVCVMYDNADVPFAVTDRSCDYDHIQLARLVVFPKEQKD